jgi:hypothetical protein
MWEAELVRESAFEPVPVPTPAIEDVRMLDDAGEAGTDGFAELGCCCCCLDVLLLLSPPPPPEPPRKGVAGRDRFAAAEAEGRALMFNEEAFGSWNMDICKDAAVVSRSPVPEDFDFISVHGVWCGGAVAVAG